jgi:uncharacterized protein Yka (UPF0111/DUF47 family)
MLTKTDIQLLKEIFVTKDEFHQGFTLLNEKVDSLTTSVDGLVKMTVVNTDELKAMSHRIHKLERWADRAGERIGIKIEH